MDSEEKNNLTDEFVHEEGEVHLEGPMRFRDLYAFQLRYSYLGLSLNGIAYWIVTGLVAGLLIVYRNSFFRCRRFFCCRARLLSLALGTVLDVLGRLLFRSLFGRRRSFLFIGVVCQSISSPVIKIY